MSPAMRRWLLIIGIGVLILSLAALVYALWPLDPIQEIIPISPEFLTLPST